MTQDEINLKKTIAQTQWIKDWILCNCISLLVVITGGGKTRVLIRIAKSMNKYHPDENIDVVVPRLFMVDDWNNNFIPNNNLTNIKVWTINTYVKERRQCGLLISDEVQHILSKDAMLFNTLITNTNFKRFIGASATLSKEEKAFALSLGIPVSTEITQEEADREGYSPKGLVFNLGINISTKTKTIYNRLTQIIEKNLAKFGGDLNLAFECTSSLNPRWKKQLINGELRGYWEEAPAVKVAREMGWINPLYDLNSVTQTFRRNKISKELNKSIHIKKDKHKMIALYGEPIDEFDIWHPLRIVASAANLTKAVKRRMNIIYDAPEKIEITKQILEQFPLKTICFSQSTKFATDLAKKLECDAYHTNIEGITIEEVKTKEFKTNMSMERFYEKNSHKWKSSKILKREIKEINDYNCIISNTIEYIIEKKLGKDKTLSYILNNFKENRTSIISTVMCLDEALDIPAIQQGISNSRIKNATGRQQIQQKGRVSRIVEDTNRISVFWNIYIKGTKEEKELEKLTKKTPNLYWVSSIEEAKMIYESKQNVLI